jgi:protein TonB
MLSMLVNTPQTVKKPEPLNSIEFIRLAREPEALSVLEPLTALKPVTIPELTAIYEPAPIAKPIEIPEPPPIPAAKPVVITKPTPKTVSPSLAKKPAPPKPVQPTLRRTDIPKSESQVAPQATTTPKTTSPTPRATPPTPSEPIFSSNVTPIVRALPKYPAQALRRSVEGWVKIEFIITTDGNVSNPRVIAAQPSDEFNDAALAAIRQWKFKGKVVNGQPATQRTIQTLRFKLD